MGQSDNNSNEESPGGSVPSRPVADDATSKFRVSASTIEFLLRVGDMIAVYLAAILAMALLPERIPDESTYLYVNLAAMTLVLSHLCIQLTGGYDVEAFFSIRESFRTSLTGWIITVLILLLAGFSFKVTDVYSRLWIGTWTSSAIGALLVFRFTVGLWAKRLRKTHNFDSRAVIVGAGRQGVQLLRFLQTQPQLTINVIGFIDERADRVADLPEEAPLLGNMQDLDALIRDGKVDQVLVSLPWAAKDRLREIVETVSDNPVKVRLAPDLAAFDYLNRDFTFLGGLPVMNLFDRPISGLDRLLKAAEDYLLATIALVALAPLMLTVAIAIKLDSKGPVFFRQAREGYGNTEFRVWKFRSMTTDNCEDDNITQASKEDQRITRVGAFIRKTSLDELPQLFNVLTGDMSMVGPRPHAPSTQAGGIRFGEAVDRYAARHRVKPGITGWAQVNGWRGETDTVEKLEQRLLHDLYYIDHWSIWLDIKILGRTAFVAWSQDSAY